MFRVAMGPIVTSLLLAGAAGADPIRASDADGPLPPSTPTVDDEGWAPLGPDEGDGSAEEPAEDEEPAQSYPPPGDPGPWNPGPLQPPPPAEDPAEATARAEGAEAEATEPAAPEEDPEAAAARRAAEEAELDAGRRVGEPFPLTRREPLLGQWGFEVDIHYGLVGTGPTRLTNDLRFGLFDWWELRTTLAPYPAGLMSRFKIGSQQGVFGALLLDGGLAAFDAGLRLVEDENESVVGPRFHWEGGIGYTRAIGPWLSVFGQARFRYRQSFLPKDEQNVFSVDVHVSYDLLKNLAITAGLGYSEVVGTPVREPTVNMTEADRPGLSHLLARDDGWSRSVTVPLAVTYGRVDSFDVDLFVTPRIYPSFDVMFGAGLRWRIPEIFNTEKLIGTNTDFFDTTPK